MGKSDSNSSVPEELRNALDQHRGRLLQFVRKRGSALLKYEEEDDLLQGIQLRILGAASEFEFRGESAALRWMLQLSEQYLIDRRRYWHACRRDGRGLLHITQATITRGRAGGAVADPTSSVTSPSSSASKRETQTLAGLVLNLLVERDQLLVRSFLNNDSLPDLAASLGLSYEAAKKSRLRALERFRKAFELASKAR
ncbi:MAG: hypothetical protein HY286_00015 [Planctomycetes bacterium]|nr:hypothetical protein [Planctomycetota bacterium]